MKLAIFWLIFVAFFSVVLVAEASYEEARGKALKELKQNLMKLRISNDATLKDFLLETDEIEKKFTEFLQDLEEIEKEISQNSCQVTLAISIDQLISILRQIHLEMPSKKFPLESFDRLRNFTKERIFYATGIAKNKEKKVPKENHWDTNGQNKKVSSDYWGEICSRGKLMALRAAKIDAYRNLTEKIEGIKISSNTTIKNFLTENDEIRIAFNRFIRNVELVGAPRYKSEGFVEVTVQIDLDDLIAELENICEKHYSGNRWKSETFASVYKYAKLSKIMATGTGVPPSQYTEQFSKETQNNSYKGKKIPHWINDTLRVTGVGYPSDDTHEIDFDAIHVAEQDAYEQLEEQIFELRFNNEMTVENLVAKNKAIKKQISQYVREAQIINSTNSLEDGAEIEMELTLRPLWNIIEKYHK